MQTSLVIYVFILWTSWTSPLLFSFWNFSWGFFSNCAFVLKRFSWFAKKLNCFEQGIYFLCVLLAVELFWSPLTFSVPGRNTTFKMWFPLISFHFGRVWFSTGCGEDRLFQVFRTFFRGRSNVLVLCRVFRRRCQKNDADFVLLRVSPSFSSESIPESKEWNSVRKERRTVW